MSSNRLFRSFITNDLNDTQYDYHIAYRILWKALLIIFNLTILSLGLVSCSEQPTPYRPPTIAFQATRPALVTETKAATPQHVETSVPISTPACINNLTYLEDLTLPDGTVVKPGESLDKRWLVENSGTCNWDENYRLFFRLILIIFVQLN